MIINDPTAIKAENRTAKSKEKNGAYRTFWEETARLHAVADSVTPPGLATYWQFLVRYRVLDSERGVLTYD